MKNVFKRLAALGLCLCLCLAPLSALADTFGARFLLRFQLDTAESVAGEALGEMLNMLQVEGTYARSGDSFDLQGFLMLDDAEETRTSFQLYGLPHRYYLRSSLLGRETAMFDMVAALEFGIKIDAHLGVPLQQLFLLLPYSTVSAFDSMFAAARPVLFAAEGSRHVYKQQLLTLCDTLSELAASDRAFTYWAQSLASLSEHPWEVSNAIEAVFSGLRDWVDSHLDNRLAINVKDGRETWAMGGFHVLERIQTSAGGEIHVRLPGLPDGSSWTLDAEWAESDAGGMALQLSILAMHADGTPLLTVSVTGDQLPRALPLDAPFSLTLSAQYENLPERSLLLSGAGNGDGAFQLTLAQADGTQLTVSGTLADFVPAAWPVWEDTVDGVWNIFSLYEQSLSEFVSAVAKPMLLGGIPLLARLPVRVCTTMMDLAEQAGVFQITMDSGSMDY